MNRLKTFIPAALLLAAAGCGGGDGPNGDDPGCFTHGECDAQSICVYGTCTLAYGRAYRLTVGEVEISELDQNGENWDALGGAPDPIVCFFTDRQQIPSSPSGAEFCTSTIQDRHSCTFDQGFETALYAGDDWLVVAYDEDVTDYEFIEAGRAAPIEVDWIKGGGFRFEGDYLEYCSVSIEVVE